MRNAPAALQRRCSARGTHVASPMVGGRLKGSSPCLQHADEGHSVVDALGRTSYTPQPKVPRGISEPRSVGARIPMPWAGFSWARRRGSAPPRHVNRGRSREAPRGVVRMAPGSQNDRRRDHCPPLAFPLAPEMDRRPEPRTRSRQTKLRRGPGSPFCLVE